MSACSPFYKRGPMRQPSRVLLPLLLLAPLLGGCDVLAGVFPKSPTTPGTWEPLLGISGPQVGTFNFDDQSNPLVGGVGGMWRYTEADGWLKVGTLTGSAGVSKVFPADDGGFYVLDTQGNVYKLDPGAKQWKPFATAQAGLPGFVGTDGTLFRLKVDANGNTSPDAVAETLAPNATTWQATAIQGMPTIEDPGHNLYYFSHTGGNTLRQDAGKGTQSPFIDCANKEFLQCGLVTEPLRLDGKDNMLVYSRQPGAMRIYRVALATGAVSLVAGLSADSGYTYAQGASVTADGTAYLSAAKSTDAYSFGDTWVFKPGDTKGKLRFASPSDQDRFDIGDAEVAPEANLIAAPDGKLYSYVAIRGGVARYKPGS